MPARIQTLTDALQLVDYINHINAHSDNAPCDFGAITLTAEEAEKLTALIKPAARLLERAAGNIRMGGMIALVRVDMKFISKLSDMG